MVTPLGVAILANRNTCDTTVLSEVVRGRQHHTRRPQRTPKNSRSRAAIEARPLSRPIQEEASMTVPPPG
ncbi:hypothetical protein J1N35_040311 [Gossypium stocksii]|uniref:Uncharacterized protein n=1 Tax=Gossypium stocksii TaxID=47602 RepID=A0A9D3UDW6_9ROSI|nr:hypothetical protein J1N35_040311 [Gossypium stocksii]